MHGLGREQAVAVVHRDAAAPGQVGAGPPDVGGVEVDEAAIQQRAGHVLSLRRIAVQQGHRFVKRPQRLASSPRPRDQQAPLQKHDTPVIRRRQRLGPVQQAQPVLGAALHGLPHRQDPQQPGGQRVVRLVQCGRVCLGPVLRPAQVPQPGTGMAGADGGRPALPSRRPR
jgi:hypothetical protein